MTQEWRAIARQVAAAISEVTAVGSRETNPNNRLVQFSYRPVNQDAAPLSIIVSESEVIFSAGKGTRFELPALEESRHEILRLARGVASGSLTETVDGRRVDFTLALDDGSEISGTSIFPRGAASESPSRIEYRPYGTE
jgi:hypothetical protein